MRIKEYFESEPTLDITAAHIGINKWNWTTVDEQDEEKAKQIMKENRFDVLPIIIDGKISRFYSTVDWNDYSSLNCNRIEDAPTLYYRTSMQDLLKKFVETKRHFFFLTNNDEVLGLVSIVNISSQLVYNYFYHCLSQLERNLTRFFTEKITHQELILFFERSTNEHLKMVYESFDKKRREGSDSVIYHHFYIQTYGFLINEFDSVLSGSERRLLKFKKKFGANSVYTKVRNSIMHPSKGLPNEEVSIKCLSEVLDDFDEINVII